VFQTGAGRADDIGMHRRDHGQGQSSGTPAATARMSMLAYAVAVLAVFVTTVIVLAVKAGTDAAMLTMLFAVTLGAIALGLWGTAMAVREIEGRREPAVDHVLVEPTTRSS
jgi:hypothetical protein